MSAMGAGSRWSPIAEVVARTLLEQADLAATVTVESFGTHGYHVGEGADPQAVAALRRAGWPPGDHRARQITSADLARLDLVLCAGRANLSRLATVRDPAPAPGKVRLLRSFDPQSGPGDDEVPDPWGRPDREFDLVVTLIERSCRGLVEHLARTGR